jgi:hypothetical protein
MAWQLRRSLTLPACSSFPTRTFPGSRSTASTRPEKLRFVAAPADRYHRHNQTLETVRSEVGMRVGNLVRLFLCVGWLGVGAMAWSQEPPPDLPPLDTPDAACAGEPWRCADYVRLEFLYWCVKNTPQPMPLLTAADPNNPAATGVLSEPGTRVLIGGRSLDLGNPSGGRFTFQSWDDGWETQGVEVGFLFLNSRSTTFSVEDPDGSLRLGYPYFDVLNRMQAVNRLSTPAVPLTFVDPFGNVISIPEVTLPGLGAAVQFTTDSDLYSFEVNKLYAALRDGCVRVDLIGGLRYVGLIEETELKASSVRLPQLPGDVYEITDSFLAHNHFLGPQAGMRAIVLGECWSFDLTAKLAAGAIAQVNVPEGTLRTNIFLPELNQPPGDIDGGMYVLQTNSEAKYRARFAIVPEVQANFGVQLTSWLRVFGGYTAMMVCSVIRPGDQFDLAINPNQSPTILFTPTPPGIGAGPEAPTLPMRTSTYWAHGLSVGFEVRY